MGTAASTSAPKMPTRSPPIRTCPPPDARRRARVRPVRWEGDAPSSAPPRPASMWITISGAGHRRRGIDERDGQVQRRGALSRGQVHEGYARGDEEECKGQHDHVGAGFHGPFHARVQLPGDLIEPEVRAVLHGQRGPEQRQPDEAEARDFLAPRIRICEEVAHQDLGGGPRRTP